MDSPYDILVKRRQADRKWEELLDSALVINELQRASGFWNSLTEEQKKDFNRLSDALAEIFNA